ncbi:hypothetical protein V8D89_009298 [Ganoderma adspersum]
MERDSHIVAPATDASELGTGEQDPPSGERKTDAEYAAAEFNDLLAIFGTTDIPDDIMAGLEAIRPPIGVDEDGVATVIVDAAYRLDDPTSAQSASGQVEEVSRREPSNREHAEDKLCE